ncbi:unnamed protein product [Trichogramma brassicae]|uniref:Uncharacterized protein n=1 Tax=Trichogramma brassicae TaxID=86971 RepID=A0A6H5ITS3_9HYME|nr:unnamed protein product [Trichogramma brassicae]
MSLRTLVSSILVLSLASRRAHGQWHDDAGPWFIATQGEPWPEPAYRRLLEQRHCLDLDTFDFKVIGAGRLIRTPCITIPFSEIYRRYNDVVYAVSIVRIIIIVVVFVVAFAGGQPELRSFTRGAREIRKLDARRVRLR